MKVLIIGSGGRCHAIAVALRRDPQVGEIICAPGNAGIGRVARLAPVKETDVEGLLRLAESEKVDLTVVGPEATLAAGLVDRFVTCGHPVFGPYAAAARIETSKEFAKGLMESAGIPTASYRVFADYAEASDWVGSHTFPTVIKFDGLAAGKGVTIARNLTEANAALREMLVERRFGKGRVVVEEFLEGPEFSLMCFVSGREVWPMPLAQDHKRAFDGDRGPNTGGMGAYTPLPFITPDDVQYAVERIMRPAAEALYDLGSPFTGVLYGGLIKTAGGIKVIEFNARFGDPETEVVLPLLESPAGELFYNIALGKPIAPRWSADAAYGVVLASQGYPGAYEKGVPVEEPADPQGEIYHMGTALTDDGRLVTAGGRVMICVGRAPTLPQARRAAMADVAAVRCEGLFHRSDIGRAAGLCDEENTPELCCGENAAGLCYGDSAPAPGSSGSAPYGPQPECCCAPGDRPPDVSGAPPHPPHTPPGPQHPDPRAGVQPAAPCNYPPASAAHAANPPQTNPPAANLPGAAHCGTLPAESPACGAARSGTLPPDGSEPQTDKHSANNNTMVISGKDLSQKLRAEMFLRVARLKARYGRAPHLAVILVGDDPASVSYVTGKARASESVGIDNTTIRRPADIPQAELLGLITQLGRDRGIDGILVQLPLPPHIDEQRVLAAIDSDKDVDGFHPLNVAALWQRLPCTLPCTPKGIMRLLHSAQVEIAGREAVVVGRSKIVGLPVAKLLLDENATVTLAHSRTRDLAAVTRRADILVAAVGRPRFITADMVKPGAVVIDVGVNRDPATGRLCGDVDFEGCAGVASAITPVPGGVGPMTICCLMENTIECFERKMSAQQASNPDRI